MDKNEKMFESICKEIKKEIGFEFPENTVFVKDVDFKIQRRNGKLTVKFTNPADISRAALIVKSNEAESDSDFEIEEKRYFEKVCLMVDCSRNAVRNVETVKKLIRNIAMAGYDSLMLYTEDTYEVNGEPMFGYLRGRYSKTEMKELNAYASGLGIEMIPCIQTLAHFNQLKRYQYSHFKCFDCSDILLVGEDRTYDLIDKMFGTLRECYSTDKIHIGMDEAWLLGRGKYLDINGYVDPFEVILSHLKKVCAIAEKHNFRPIMWSDMFWRIAYADGKYKNSDGKVVIPREVLDKIPKKLTLCHWDYHYVNPQGYRKKLEIHEQFDNEIWFAGGTVEDNRGFLPHLTYSIKVAEAAIEEASKHKVQSLMETVWGDNGGECSLFANLPAIIHYAYTARKIGRERLEKEFKTLTGYEFNEFMKIEEAQTFCGRFTEDIANPAKYGLYSDVFSGVADSVIVPEDKKYFKLARENIAGLRTGQYGYLFEAAYRLNDVLELKYDMGIRLRNAYKRKSAGEMKKCFKDMSVLLKKLSLFIDAYRRQWLKENKSQGLEIQEIRLGGLKERIIGCRARVGEYVKGKIKTIAELEEEILPQAVSRVIAPGRCDLFSYEAIASVNSFDGFTEVDV